MILERFNRKEDASKETNLSRQRALTSTNKQRREEFERKEKCG